MIKSLALSPKQIEAINHCDAKINIFEGPVRAGKSYAALLAFILCCVKGIQGAAAICGFTEKSIKRNVIIPLEELLGENIKYFPHKGEVWIGARRCHVVSAGKEDSLKALTGSTLAYMLIDEVVLLPQSFFTLALTRVSLKESKIIATCNPDSSHHWLKKNFIDRGSDADTKVFSFKLEDNPSLDPHYISFLHKQYGGVWKERLVYGKWVMAEGSVFPFFSEKDHIIKEIPQAKEYIVGVDYGIHNPTVFLMIGYQPEDSETPWWVEKEFYYDSSKEGVKQVTDYDLGNFFEEFIDTYYVDRIYLDPSALSFRRELGKRGIKGLRYGDNDVLTGVRFLSQLLSQKKLKIHPSCQSLIEELTNYCWDRKSCEKGKEQPIKRKDHAVDALRYAVFSRYFLKNENNKDSAYYQEFERRYRWAE